MDLFNLKDPSSQRNFSHALLYSGFVNQATTELEKSINLQTNLAQKGDEICHFASCFIDNQNCNLKKSFELVEDGLNLLNNVID